MFYAKFAGLCVTLTLTLDSTQARLAALLVMVQDSGSGEASSRQDPPDMLDLMDDLLALSHDGKLNVRVSPGDKYLADTSADVVEQGGFIPTRESVKMESEKRFSRGKIRTNTKAGR